MKIVEQRAVVNWITPDAVASIERAARVCYRSEGAIAPGSAERMVQKLLASGHEAMIEHACCQVEVTTDRGISHEFVRHRIASFAQESTRYCRYKSGIRVIKPLDLDGKQYDIWMRSIDEAQYAYDQLLALGASPQQARDVLPTCIACDMVITTNMREWRHFFKLRKNGTTGKPHPKMQQLATLIHAAMLPWAGCLISDLVT